MPTTHPSTAGALPVTSVTEVLGHHSGESFEQSVAPEHLPRWIESLNMILDSEQPWRFLGRVHLQGREYLHAEHLYVPLANDNNKPVFIMGLCRYTPRLSDDDSVWGKRAGLDPRWIVLDLPSLISFPCRPWHTGRVEGFMRTSRSLYFGWLILLAARDIGTACPGGDRICLRPVRAAAPGGIPHLARRRQLLGAGAVSGRVRWRRRWWAGCWTAGRSGRRCRWGALLFGRGACRHRAGAVAAADGAASAGALRPGLCDDFVPDGVHSDGALVLAPPRPGDGHCRRCHLSGGGLVVVPLLARAIAAYGWRTALLYEAGIVTVIIIALALLFLREPAGRYGAGGASGK